MVHLMRMLPAFATLPGMPRPLALLLTLGVLAVAPSARAAHPPATPPDSMRSIVTRDFELYAPTDDDLRRSGDDLRIAVTQFVNYMGQSPKKMAFLIFRSTAERDRYDFRPFTRRGLPVVPVVLPAMPAGSGAAPGGKPGSDTGPEPISHEAGHRFFVDYMDHALATAHGGERGTGSSNAAQAGAGGHPTHEAVPDWFEEAVAALCERPAYQNRRIEFMRSRLSKRIPFDELLTMPIPAEPAAAGKGAAKSTGAAKTGGSAPSEPAAIFRAEALSLARFIVSREDARFIGTIAEGVTAGRTVGEVLNTSQNLFAKPEALEKQWLEWMESSNGATGRAKD